MKRTIIAVLVAVAAFNVSANTDFVGTGDYREDKAAQAEVDSAQNKRIDGKLDKEVYTLNQITQNSTNTLLTHRIADANAAFQQRAGDLDARIADSEANQQAVNKQLAQQSRDIADQKRQASSIKQQQDADRKEYRNGISGVAALTGVPEVAQGQDFFIGAGVGQFKNSTSVAVGASAFTSTNSKIKAGVSFSNDGDAVLSAGFGVGF